MYNCKNFLMNWNKYKHNLSLTNTGEKYSKWIAIDSLLPIASIFYKEWLR